jgi:uncharacterized protein
MALPDPSKDSIAIVTGASSGIGAELARGLARRGHNVGLVARRRDRLQELADELNGAVRAEVLEADLEDAGSRDKLATAIATLDLRVSVLCNNAGFGTYDDFTELDREREIAEVRTNVEAVVDLTGRWLPKMTERGEAPSSTPHPPPPSSRSPATRPTRRRRRSSCRSRRLCTPRSPVRASPSPRSARAR